MAIRIIVQSYAGEAASPEVYDSASYATPAAAIAGIVSGFLTVTVAPSPQSAAGGPPSPEVMAISTAQIKAIIGA